MIDLSYPIGRFQRPESISQDDLAAAIEAMAVLPAQLRATVNGWTNEQLDTPYRPDGWTVRQVIHHLPDSHINSYVRYRLALTESQPTIKPYDEDAWAHLPDAQSAPVDLSLALLDALHRRWVVLLRSLKAEQWACTCQHPENGTVRLDMTLLIYAWHGRHHLAHITRLRDRMGW